MFAFHKDGRCIQVSISAKVKLVAEDRKSSLKKNKYSLHSMSMGSPQGPKSTPVYGTPFMDGIVRLSYVQNVYLYKTTQELETVPHLSVTGLYYLLRQMFTKSKLTTVIFQSDRSRVFIN